MRRALFLLMALLVGFLRAADPTPPETPKAAVEATGDEQDAEILRRLRTRLERQGETVQREIHRLGNKTLEFEAFAAVEADFQMMSTILSDFSRYPQWILKNINQRPSGGTYYMQINKLFPDPKDKALIDTSVTLDLPLYHSNIQRQFKVGSHAAPQNFTLDFETLPNELAVIESAKGQLKVFHADKKPHWLWIYARGRIVIRPWLLYEALPERILNRESGERLQTLLENYQAEEDRIRRLKGSAKSSRIPKEKGEVPREKASLPSPK